jgi:hypothetical protein
MQASSRIATKRFCIDSHNVEINWELATAAKAEGLFAKRSCRCVLLPYRAGV